MDNRKNDIDELIGKHLTGESSPEEALVVKLWCSESEANRRYFDQMKLIFERTASLKATIDVDEDAAWQKLKAKLQEDKKIIPLRPANPAGLFWKIAASIIVVLGVSLFAYRMFSPITPIDVVADRKTVTDTLPDGSEVVLNKKTQLSYAFNKKKNEHTVKLEGEAYFSIHHDDDKTFVIDASGVFIRDIGTSFNVKAYPDSSTIEVVVEEGEVIFYTDTDSGISLKAHGKGVYNKITKTFSIEEPEQNVTAYKTKVFFFSDSYLTTVVEELNSVYDKKIIISDALKNCKLTVNFDNEDIEEIAEVIRETHGLTLRETPEGILLEGKPCQN